MDLVASILTIRLRGGDQRYNGQVNIIGGDRVAECNHKHKTRSVAYECAEKLLAASK